MNENDNTTYQNLRNAAVAVLSRKLIAINAYIKNQERAQISNLTLQLYDLEKELHLKLTKGRK